MLVGMDAVLGYHKLTLLSGTIALYGSSVKHLSTIDIELRIDYACLMLVTSAEAFDGIWAALLRGGNR